LNNEVYLKLLKIKNLFFMKKACYILCTILLTSIGFAQNVVNFQADIANRNGDVIYIKNKKNQIIKEIKVNEKGIFNDSFEVADGEYLMFDGVEYAQLFLKNGFDLKLKMDAKAFDESIKFSGKGEAENNYLAQATIAESTFKYEDLLAADEVNFNKMIETKKTNDFEKLDKAKLDPQFVTLQKKNVEMSLTGLKQYYNQKLAANKMNNTPSLTFDYENHKGGKTKLEDLRGKYVYIDVWATWCGPCRQEIPFLKKVEEKYHGKNIEFVSISVDVDKDHEKWKTFVTEKELGGIQLFADKNWNSEFMKSYGINSIPRFILIDPKGNIVKADAERPSSPKLQEELDKLLK
jgi:thiol-disulfide isomerase/thioredoxin